MAYSNDEMQGTPTDPADHPAYNKPDATVHMAGEVVPFTIPSIISSGNRARGELLGDPSRNSENASADKVKAVPIPFPGKKDK